MACTLFYLKLIIKLKRIQNFDSVLALGYPDILLSQEDVDTLARMGVDLSSTPIRTDNEEIKAWHNAPANYNVYDAKSIFSELGLNLVWSDFKTTRGDEIIIDLNNWLAPEYYEQFDLVLDTGTLEHIFNVGTAFLNCFRALKKKGIFIHTSPISRFNHGFWSFNPVLYNDFTNQTDTQIIFAAGFTISHDWRLSWFKLPSKERFNQAPPGCGFLIVFRKGSNYSEVIPQQLKYA